MNRSFLLLVLGVVVAAGCGSGPPTDGVVHEHADPFLGIPVDSLRAAGVRHWAGRNAAGDSVSWSDLSARQEANR